MSEVDKHEKENKSPPGNGGSQKDVTDGVGGHGGPLLRVKIPPRHSRTQATSNIG
jgi:hypothetical protein